MKTQIQVDEWLTAAFGAPVTATERAHMDARVAAMLKETPPRRRRTGIRLTRGLLLAAALLILVPALVGGAVVYFSTEAPYGMGNADQYEAELAAAKAVTPIPPGATWPPHLDGAPDRSASYGVGLGRSMVEINAYCLWLSHWYEARTSGDAARANAAAAVLDKARGWTSFNDLGAHWTFRQGINAVIDAVQEGDAGRVRQELETNC